MPFGPEFINMFCGELNASYIPRNPRISRIEGGESWVALRGGADNWLLLSWGARKSGVCVINDETVEVLKNAAPARTPLVEFLKSQLLKGQLIEAKQLQYDRVIEIEATRLVSAGVVNRRFLMIEATEPNGNFLFLDANRVIMEAARHVAPDENSYRTLMPGHSYVAPPPYMGPLPSEVQELEFETVHKLKGIGKPLATLIYDNWCNLKPTEWLSYANRIYENPAEMIAQRTSKDYLTCFPYVFPGCEKYPDAVSAADVLARALIDGVRGRILSLGEKTVAHMIKSMERHRDGILKQIERYASIEKLRQSGQLLLEHAHEVPVRADKVSLTSWDGALTMEISLDPQLSAVQNAERYFKKYRKAGKIEPDKLRADADEVNNAIDELIEQRQLLSAIEDIGQLEMVVNDIISSDKRAWVREKRVFAPVSKQGKKKAPLPPHLRYEIKGSIVLVGLNARGNRYVTFKQAGQQDFWLHAHELAGAHVIVKLGKEPDDNAADEIFNFAASLAASYSKGAGAIRVMVDCTERRHVRAIPGTVAHVTYTDTRVFTVSPKFWREYLAENSSAHEE